MKIFNIFALCLLLPATIFCGGGNQPIKEDENKEEEKVDVLGIAIVALNRISSKLNENYEIYKSYKERFEQWKKLNSDAEEVKQQCATIFKIEKISKLTWKELKSLEQAFAQAA